MPDPANSPFTTGEPFSRLYERDTRGLPDSDAFRGRLGATISRMIRRTNAAATGPDHGLRFFCDYLTRECGVRFIRDVHNEWDVEASFRAWPVGQLLDCITHIWRWFDAGVQDNESPPEDREVDYRHRNSWLTFVRRALNEENMAYRVDDECGIHHRIDTAFFEAAAQAIRGLEAEGLQAVRREVANANRYIQATPPEPLAAVRSAFGALEGLFTITFGGSQMKSVDVRQKLGGDVTRRHPNGRAHLDLVESMAKWVDAVHNFRHGTAEPTREEAVLILSQAWAWLRYVVDTRAAA